MDPPARNAMWRFGFPNPVNYNDNELFCGGYAGLLHKYTTYSQKTITTTTICVFSVQWEQNSGNCGVCGDAYNFRSPRPHEAGGAYAKGIITRFYSAGQVYSFSS